MSKNFVVSENPEGELSLSVTGSLSSNDRANLTEQRFVNVFLRSGDHRNLDYLKSSQETVRILNVGSEQFDWPLISDLPDLKTLIIGAYWTVPWDQFENPGLESLSATWNSRYRAEDLKFSSLKQLKMIGWTQSNLDALGNFSGLTYLDLVDARQLSDLRALSGLPHVTTLRLRGAPKLTSLAGIESLRTIIALHLEGLKRLGDFAGLNLLQSLRGLVSMVAGPFLRYRSHRGRPARACTCGGTGASRSPDDGLRELIFG